MISNQLNQFMKMDPVISKQNGGVYAMDQLPPIVDNTPCIYIINSQEFNKHIMAIGSVLL